MGVAAECLMAVLASGAGDDGSDSEIARAYVGAMIVLEAFNEIRMLRKAWE